jgi:hypothetical protein
VDVGDKMDRCATNAGGAVSCATLQQGEIDTKDFVGQGHHRMRQSSRRRQRRRSVLRALEQRLVRAIHRLVDVLG